MLFCYIFRRHEASLELGVHEGSLERMNRGNIPGYYYDDEKKKYFKIQANHIAPTNAKYSKTNVNQEQRQKREIKRRKVQENRVLRETVKRAQILRHPLLTGCGLQRELGNRPQSLNRASRDTVFVQGLETSYLELNVTGFVHTGVTDAQRLPYDRSLLAVTLYRGSHAVCLYDFFHDPVVSKVLPAQQPIVAFPEKIVSMESAMISSSRYLLASGNQFSSGYYYFGSLDVERSTNMFPITELRSIRTLWASKMNPSMPIAAFTGTGAVVVTSVEAPRPSIGVQRLDNDTESFALDWLSPYVLTYGITHEETNLQFRHCAYLWDVRIKNGNNVAANAARIKRAQRITGIKRPDERYETPINL